MGWLFEMGAGLYGWMTAQAPWRRSCGLMAERLPPGENLRILDLGCGPGVSALELARRRPGDAVAGIDSAWRMLRQAQRRHVAEGRAAGRISWIRADAAQLPFASGSIDALTGHSFLYLLPDRDAALREFLRVLRPGGRLVLVEPNDRPLRIGELLGVSRDPRFLLSMGLWRLASRIRGRFVATRLSATLRGAGFARCQVDETLAGMALYAHAQKA